MTDRPPIFQPFAPFVEMYIKGQDILRGSNDRPRTLISFSHDIYVGHQGGMWTIQVFDPDYVATEELLLSIGNQASEVAVATEVYGTQPTQGNDEHKYWVVGGAYFRYGYVGNNPGEFITSIGPGGEKYFYGNVHSYTASYQAEGTYITLRGDSIAGGLGIAKEKTYAASYAADPYDVIKAVCEEEGWILTSPAATSGIKLLPTEQQPVGTKSVDNGIDNTEEMPPVFRKKENQDSYAFLTELCSKLRTSSPEYSNYIVRWDARVDFVAGENGGVTESPNIYCYFGPLDIKQNIVRTYVYLRDATTDIISFTPDINVNLLGKGGTVGVTYKSHDARTAELDTHFIDELNRGKKYFRPERETIPYLSGPEALMLQSGPLEFPGEETVIEGAQTGQQTITFKEAPDPDAPVKEQSSPKSNRQDADNQLLNNWLGMWLWANTATLEIIGDPSPELAPTKVISVLMYVPVGDQVRLHWVSGLWWITGASHTIQGGSFTTTLELGRMGMSAGGITTEGFAQTVGSSLQAPGAMERAGG